jgi:hypothetical protein
LIENGLLVLKKFFKNFKVKKLFHCYLPLEKGAPLSLDKLDFHPPEDDLCKVWLKLAHWFWRSQKCEKLTDGQQTIRNLT